VLLARKAGDEQGGDFIPDQLVNERIGLHEDVNRGFVEAVHQAAELGGIHFLGECGRAAHIHEQHGQHDLRAARILGIEEVAGCAKPGGSWPTGDHPSQKCA
jgi:hypothetical protein